MRSLVLFAASLLLCSSVFSAAIYGTNYPAGTGGSTTGAGSTLPPSLMKILVSENCSGIYVLVQSSDYMADNPAVPNASIEVDALPRANIMVIATGTTDAHGIFAFNTTSANISITATKDNYSATRTEFEPQHPSCSSPPKLAVSFSSDCAQGTAVISVTADGKPAQRAVVSVGGNEAGFTDASGNLSLKLAGPAELTVAYQGAELNTTYAPDCPATKNATAPPPANTSPSPSGSASGSVSQPQPAAPSQPGEPLNLPLIGGVIVVMVVVLFILSRSLGKGGKSSIGPGPIPPARQIGPGPMKSKSQIGPGPMKKEIGPGPM